MKNNFLITVIVLLTFVLTINSGYSPSNYVIWDENRKLSWDDFQGVPDNKVYSDIAALTSSGIVHYKGCENGNIIYNVKAYFEKQNSWVKEEAYTDYHLNHEQLHFDITELYARKLRKELAKMNFKCGEEAEFDQFVRDFLNKWQSAQINYDRLTHNSIKRDVQKEWDFLVAVELSIYDEHKSHEE